MRITNFLSEFYLSFPFCFLNSLILSPECKILSIGDIFPLTRMLQYAKFVSMKTIGRSRSGIEVRIKMMRMNITAREMAGELGVTPSFVHQCITGHRNNGQVREYIAKRLGSTVEKLWPACANRLRQPPMPRLRTPGGSGGQETSAGKPERKAA